MHPVRVLPLSFLAFALLANSAVVAQDGKKYTLDNKLTVGIRRSIQVVREYRDTTEGIVAGEVCTRAKQAFWTSSLTHEWHMELHENGAAKRVMRTYEKLKREREAETWIQITDNTLKSARAEVKDARKGGIFVVDITSDGKRAIHGPTPTIFFEIDKKRICEPLEMNMLPAGQVAVGDAWTIPGASCEAFTDREDNILEKEDPEPYESGDLTVKFAGTETKENDLCAELAVSGVLVYRLVKKAAYGDDIVTDYKTEVTVKGTALFNIAKGRMESRVLEATIKRSGKLNGIETSGTGTLKDERSYHTAFIFEAAPDNGVDDCAEGVEKAAGFKHGKIAPEHIVLARNSAVGGRIVLFDPATKKQVKTLCALPAGKFVDHLSLSPGRDKIAFAATLNNEISISPWNVFVLELASGEINQVTPNWATGQGLAEPLPGEGATITGRVSFYDEFERATRSDSITGDVQLDHSRCHVALNGSSFRIEHAPAGNLLLRVKAKVPKPRHGVPRNMTVYSRDASVVMLVNAEAGKVVDIGNLTLTIGAADMVYCNPTWHAKGLQGSLSSSNLTWAADYPERAFNLDTKPTLAEFACGFALNPKGSMLAYSSTLSGADKIIAAKPDSHETIKTISLEGIGVDIEYNARLTWIDNDAVFGGGQGRCRTEFYADSPALFSASFANGEARLLKTIPEWSGRHIIDVTISSDGKTAYLTLSGKLPLTDEERCELYSWDPSTDTLTRLTSFSGALSVSNGGR